MKKLVKETKKDGKTHTRGRPKKAITRSVSLVVRMTPIERLSIEGRAKGAGMVVSEWFRKSARKAVIRPRLSREEAGYLRTLSGMANNLNQLTKLAHSAGLVTLIASLRQTLATVETLMERIGRDDS